MDRPIARGGMSTVYRCLDTRLDREVAAKVMHPRYVDDPLFLDRFQREARAMAQMSHPNLVNVYDFSSHGEDVFLIMELITGGTLRELLAERGPMPPHAAAEVMRSMLTGLSVAHRRGLVHRDIKPDNILINGDNSVKLADFGLVRAASESQRSTDQIVGTVAYLSPSKSTVPSSPKLRTSTPPASCSLNCSPVPSRFPATPHWRTRWRDCTGMCHHHPHASRGAHAFRRARGHRHCPPPPRPLR